MRSRSIGTGRHDPPGVLRAISRRAGYLLPAAVLATTLVATTGGAATAEPALTIDDAKAQVQQLQMQASILDQQWDGIGQKISDTKADLAQRQSDVKAQSAKVAQLRIQLGRLALAEFQNRNIDTRAQLFVTQDTQGFLNQMSTVEKVSDNQNAALQQYQAEQANLTDLQQAEAADLAALQTDQQQLVSVRAASDKKVADAQAVLNRLTEEQRRKLEAERQAQEAAARKSALAEAAQARAAAAAATSRSAARTATASNADSGSNSGSNSGSDGGSTAGSSSNVSVPPGSSKGQEALAFALAQIGKPYVFGAAGPNAYDCSGLTSAAWRSAGVSLDRTSQAQISDGVAVSESQLQPGDLVFFYPGPGGPGHVAIYAGDGYVVHAPHPGSSVQKLKMSYMPFAGARRVG